MWDLHTTQRLNEQAAQRELAEAAEDFERDFWVTRDLRTAEALADALDAPIVVAEDDCDALVGYVKELAAQRDEARELARRVRRAWPARA